MATIPDDAKTHIVQALACFDTPSEVAESVNVNFGLRVSRQQIEAYDPTKLAGRRLARKWRLQRKLEARLGENWTRPRGMRQRTYERLLDRLVDCEERRDAAFCAVAARLFGDVDLDRLARRGHS